MNSSICSNIILKKILKFEYVHILYYLTKNKLNVLQHEQNTSSPPYCLTTPKMDVDFTNVEGVIAGAGSLLCFNLIFVWLVKKKKKKKKIVKMIVTLILWSQS